MRFDGVEHLIDSNGFDLLGLSCDFDENLGVDIVAVFGNELTQISKQLQDIDTLLQLLGRKVGINYIHMELFLC